MRLALQRFDFGPTFTLGTLTVDALPFGYACEDYDDGTDSPIYAKADWGKLCVPAGLFKIDWTFSNRFQRMMPILVGVPGRQGIRIHAGNSATDTEGCLLPGTQVDLAGGQVKHSQAAIDWLYPRIEAAVKTGSCDIRISRSPTGVLAKRPG